MVPKKCNVCFLPIFNIGTDVKNNNFVCHRRCTRCYQCKMSLARKLYSYVYQGRLFCDETCLRFKSINPMCQKCFKILKDCDLARQINGRYYHVDCFKCDTCKQKLTTGEMYHIVNNTIWCKVHAKTKIKKMAYTRTVINEMQREILVNNFAECKYPTVSQMKKIANETDLEYKTVRIWFQNNRARRTF